MIKDLVQKNRSYRRFYENVSVDTGTLQELVDLARLSASGANRQPLKYVLSTNRAMNVLIFECLGWAAYLKDWKGPDEGERPSAYIIILNDAQIHHTPGVDHGIAAQSIMLGAAEKGLGGCIIATINRKKLQLDLAIDDHYEIMLVLALGKPNEKIIIELIDDDGDVKYWHDEQRRHHLPKRRLEDIVLKQFE